MISNGWAAPSAARTAATVVGMSWMDVVLSTTNVNTSSGVPAAPYSSYNRFPARRPIGVAALLSPIRLAVTLDAMPSMASVSCEARGNSGRKIGHSRTVSPLQMPDFCISSRIPDHNPMTPTSARQSVTACSAPCVTAADSSAVLPVMQAVTQARMIMPAHKPFIMRFTPFSRRCSAFFFSYHLYLDYVFSMEGYYYYEINRNCPQS